MKETKDRVQAMIETTRRFATISNVHEKPATTERDLNWLLEELDWVQARMERLEDHIDLLYSDSGMWEDDPMYDSEMVE